MSKTKINLSKFSLFFLTTKNKNRTEYFAKYEKKYFPISENVFKILDKTLKEKYDFLILAMIKKYIKI